MFRIVFIIFLTQNVILNSRVLYKEKKITELQNK
jgi:hypothetical protein